MFNFSFFEKRNNPSGKRQNISEKLTYFFSAFAVGAPLEAADADGDGRASAVFVET